MADEVLARVRASRADLVRFLSLSALGGPDGSGAYFDDLLLTISDDGIETPASNPAVSPHSYCTFLPEYFDTFAIEAGGHVEALVDATTTRRWLRWFDAEHPIEMRFTSSQPHQSIATSTVLSYDTREVSIDCAPGDVALDSLSRDLPDRFDDQEGFLDDGASVVPTQIRVATADLRAIVEAVDRCSESVAYPLVASGERLEFALDCDEVTARTTFDAKAMSGPAIENYYGDGFAHLPDALGSEAILQTSPGGPLAALQPHDEYVLRYILSPVDRAFV
jgi:hypothetical protein